MSGVGPETWAPLPGPAAPAAVPGAVPAAVDSLPGTLRNPAWSTRAAAVERLCRVPATAGAIGRVGGPSAPPALAALLHDGHPSLRRAAAALQRAGGGP